jgi:hypothetical protein
MIDSLFNINNQMKLAIVIMLAAGYAIYETKPTYFFKDSGEFKQFGLKSDETPFPFFMIVTLIGFTSYYGLLLKEGKYV